MKTSSDGNNIYNFSIDCSDILDSVFETPIFCRLISAFYFALNFPEKKPGGHAPSTADEFFANMEADSGLLPGVPLRAGIDSRIERLAARLFCLDAGQFINNPGIIGRMYQYFNQKSKDAAYSGLKKNIKISGDSLAPATQIFTPDWITGYLTENAVWRKAGLEPPAVKNSKTAANNPHSGEYYIRDADMKLDLSIKDPLGMKLLDPCMGCGHMLLGAFGTLMELYKTLGVDQKKAAARILGKNLFGLDVDGTAVELGRFALIMKAASYDPEILNEIPITNLFSVTDSGLPHAAELGSLLEPGPEDTKPGACAVLRGQYDIVATNPPYMGNHNMSGILSSFVKEHYALSKTDLGTVFMERAFKFCAPDGIIAMININAWLFLPTYERFRECIIMKKTVLNLADLDRGAFGNNLSRTAAFVMANSRYEGYISAFLKLYGDTGASDNGIAAKINANEKREHNRNQPGDEKRRMFRDTGRRHYCNANEFLSIPRKIFAYDAAERTRGVMSGVKRLALYGSPKQGLKTGDNSRFIRLWHEVPREEINFCAHSREEAAASGRKWFPYNKAGEYRKWYGNFRYVVNWENDGAEIRGFIRPDGKPGSRPQNMEYFFKSSVSWNMVANSLSARYIPGGFIFDGSCGCVFTGHEQYILGFLNSCAAKELLNVTSRSVNFNVGQIADLPLIMSDACYADIYDSVEKCVSLSKREWDGSEASWDFCEHPVAALADETRRGAGLRDLFEIYAKWRAGMLNDLKTNEEHIDMIFSELYGIKPGTAVSRPDAAFDAREVMRSLISYAVGCMFGRYRRDDRIAIASGSVGMPEAADFFISFLEILFGREKSEENKKFAASVLGGRHFGRPEDSIRDYFVNYFLRDHEKAYLSRPVYLPRGDGMIYSRN